MPEAPSATPEASRTRKLLRAPRRIAPRLEPRSHLRASRPRGLRARGADGAGNGGRVHLCGGGRAVHRPAGRARTRLRGHHRDCARTRVRGRHRLLHRRHRRGIAPLRRGRPAGRGPRRGADHPPRARGVACARRSRRRLRSERARAHGRGRRDRRHGNAACPDHVRGHGDDHPAVPEQRHPARRRGCPVGDAGVVALERDQHRAGPVPDLRARAVPRTRPSRRRGRHDHRPGVRRALPVLGARARLTAPDSAGRISGPSGG